MGLLLLLRCGSLWWLLLFCALLGPLPLAHAKIATGKFSTSKAAAAYIDTFGCAIGACSWEVQLRLAHADAAPPKRKGNAPPNRQSRENGQGVVRVRMLLDDTWEDASVAHRPSCSNVVNARSTRSVTLPLDGSWATAYGELTQYARPHHWYWVIDDCDDGIRSALDRVEGGVHAGTKLTIEWRLTTKQYNGSHLSYELFGMSKILLLHVVSYAAALLFILSRIRGRKSHRGRVHRLLQLLICCLSMECVSCFLQLLHIWAFASNGRGSVTLDSLGEMIKFADQVAISALLVAIAMGYSLNVPAPQSNALFWRVAAVVGVLHVILVIFDRLTRDARDAYVGTAGVIGFLMVMIRMVIWAAFLILGIVTMSRANTPPDVREFLQKFLAVGSLWFAAYPLLFVAIHFCHAYLQSRVLTNGLFFTQLGALVALAVLFASGSGRYFRVSEMAQSYLPGGYLSPTGMFRMD